MLPSSLYLHYAIKVWSKQGKLNSTNKTRISLLDGAIISSLSDLLRHLHEAAVKDLLITYIAHVLIVNGLIHLFFFLFPHLGSIINRVNTAHSLIFLVVLSQLLHLEQVIDLLLEDWVELLHAALDGVVKGRYFGEVKNQRLSCKKFDGVEGKHQGLYCSDQIKMYNYETLEIDGETYQQISCNVNLFQLKNQDCCD